MPAGCVATRVAVGGVTDVLLTPNSYPVHSKSYCFIFGPRCRRLAGDADVREAQHGQPLSRAARHRRQFPWRPATAHTVVCGRNCLWSSPRNETAGQQQSGHNSCWWAGQCSFFRAFLTGLAQMCRERALRTFISCIFVTTINMSYALTSYCGLRWRVLHACERWEGGTQWSARVHGSTDSDRK